SSGTITDKAEFVSCSSTVEVEGKGIVHAQDMMISNNKNTAPSPLLQPPLVQTIQDETPVIPDQGKVTINFIDPFEEPMEGVPFKVKINKEERIKEKQEFTMSRGNLVCLLDKEDFTYSSNSHAHIDIKHKELGMRKTRRNHGK
ncbi:MAG: DUF4150 domain-containing protein, partial [Desulfobacteraceae bacterium]|nr:DUF4150 domain-containing protein [Desulfobacteraceae bacterium]